MQRIVQLSTILTLSCLTGCASLFTGTTQSIMVETQPAGADCQVTKGGMLVGEVKSTPGYVRVHRGSVGLEIACRKPGYAVAQTAAPTEIEAWLFGNAVIGGLVGVVVDFSTGAAYRYDDYTMLAMQANPGATGPVIASNVPPDGNGYTYQPLTRAYRTRGNNADPLVVPSATPDGDVTYRWHSTD
jgi:hypothetical protein